MECFYEMNELKIPFKDKMLFHTEDNAQFVKIKTPTDFVMSNGETLRLSSGTVTTAAELFPHRQHTLSVCKRCRSEWLMAIKEWFDAKPTTPDMDADEYAPSTVGSGIFIRRNGSRIEISDEEWYKLNPGREPVRLPKESKK
jgi:hypothetical protein